MSQTTPTVSRARQISLWLAQIVLAAIYIPAGMMKLLSPVADVAAQIPWAAEVPTWFLRGIGCIDLAAGCGIFLPALIRVLPKLTGTAALGSMLLQVCAMAFHAYRGEWMVLPFNVVIIGLSYLVWRNHRHPS